MAGIRFASIRPLSAGTAASYKMSTRGQVGDRLRRGNCAPTSHAASADSVDCSAEASGPQTLFATPLPGAAAASLAAGDQISHWPYRAPESGRAP
jgi:hypothetical protein